MKNRIIIWTAALMAAFTVSAQNVPLNIDQATSVIEAPRVLFFEVNAVAISNALASIGFTSGTPANAALLDAALNVFEFDLTVLGTLAAQGLSVDNVEATTLTLPGLTESGFLYTDVSDEVVSLTPVASSVPGWDGAGAPTTYLVSSLGGGGGSSWFDDVELANPNFANNWLLKTVVSGTNVTFVPADDLTGSGASITPDFSAGTYHTFTLTGNATLNAPSNVTADMVGWPFRVVLLQDATGTRVLSSLNAAYKLNDMLPSIVLNTNATYRDMLTIIPRSTTVFDIVAHTRGMQP